MSIDPELMKQLITSFTSEFDELSSIITQGLLELEKSSSPIENEHQITTILRAVHTIKGTSRSLGIIDLASLAHDLETLITESKNNTFNLSSSIIDKCFKSLDKMKISLKTFVNLTLDVKSDETLVMNESILTDSIRIPVANIERISAILEEIHSNKISIDEFMNQLIKSSSHMNLSFQKNILNEYNVLFDTLQDEIRFLRLVPFSNLLCNMPRFVRDLSHELNKNIEIKILGDEVKLDKLILEIIKDPIIHIIRNAIDHGIESPSVRESLGKPSAGLITISIHEEGSKINISISDDGGGINIENLKNTALRKNLYTKHDLSKMSDDDILNIVFSAGFSTKDIITDVSGRGVGLDIVKTNLAKVNGSISIITHEGKGTVFNICIPLTLSSERGLIIKICEQMFALPIQFIERVLTVSSKEIMEVEGAPVVLIDKHAIPLYSLAAILGMNQDTQIMSDNLPIVLLKKENRSIALFVDNIISEKEIVIKPLNKPTSNVPCVSGGTLVGNNNVILVLDAVSIIDRVYLNKNIKHIELGTRNVEIQTIPHILVVDDSITTRILEKNILESNSYKVSIAVNGQEAWDLLQTNSYSLLITDVSMPLMDGFELTERVKNDKTLQTMPVIIVTSLNSEDEKKRGIDVGADAYIVKNEFESGHLLQIVEQLV
jgi:two-component system chemotaxis sensor kinase CheA